MGSLQRAISRGNARRVARDLPKGSVRRVWVRSQSFHLGMAAAVVGLGFGFPAIAQNPAAGGGAFVGLPPPSTMIGPLRRLPDGGIGVVPESARPPAQHPPAAAAALPPPRGAASEPVAVKPAVVPESTRPLTPPPAAAPASPSPVAAPESVAATPAVAAARPPAPPADPSGAPAAASTSPQPSPPAPPPRATIVSQIHNAPGWQPSHTYTAAAGPFTRVVNGPGWTPATGGDRGFLQRFVSTFTGGSGEGVPNGRYYPGQSLDAYQLTSTGTCTSASSSGPTSAGAAIKDGTCTWKHLSPVDYISLTGWAFDNRPWQSGTLYHFLDYVTAGSPLRVYALEADSCRSTVAPTGSNANSPVAASDGCHWQYQADIIYTSRKSYIPTETFTDRKSAATLQMNASYEAQLWNDREYVAGQNGEAVPIRTQGHNDYLREGGVIRGCDAPPCYHTIITTAPNESFRDRYKPSDPLTGYDPTKGVAIRNNLPSRHPFEPAGIDVHDNFVDIIGLQIKSVHGAAVNGMSSFGNDMTIRNCILEGGSDDKWTSHAAVTTDTSSVVANSLVIAHGSIGINFKYPGYALHDTILNPEHVVNSVGITTWHDWVFKGQTVSNTAIFGFAHAAASTAEITSSGPAVTWLGGHNVTDAPQGDAASGTQGGVVYTLPDTTYGVSAAAAFINPGSDWRVKSGGLLADRGSAYGTFGLYCDTGGYKPNPNCPQRENYNFDTPDLVGTARPQADRYDIGAWQRLFSQAAEPAGR